MLALVNLMLKNLWVLQPYSLIDARQTASEVTQNHRLAVVYVSQHMFALAIRFGRSLY